MCFLYIWGVFVGLVVKVFSQGWIRSLRFGRFEVFFWIRIEDLRKVEFLAVAGWLCRGLSSGWKISEIEECVWAVGGSRGEESEEFVVCSLEGVWLFLGGLWNVTRQHRDQSFLGWSGNHKHYSVASFICNSRYWSIVRGICTPAHAALFLILVLPLCVPSFRGHVFPNWHGRLMFNLNWGSRRNLEERRTSFPGC